MIQLSTGLARLDLVEHASGVVLAALLVAACAHDVRSRRIPNRIVLATLLVGVVGAAAGATGVGVTGALASALLGLALWLPFHAMGWMGAGDVKLFAAASAWLSLSQVANAALVAAFAGGALSLLWMLRVHGAVGVLARVAGQPMSRSPVLALVGTARALGRSARDGGGAERRSVPYGVAMAAGLLAAWFGVALVRF